jgi:hypothetical protein
MYVVLRSRAGYAALIVLLSVLTFAECSCVVVEESPSTRAPRYVATRRIVVVPANQGTQGRSIASSDQHAVLPVRAAGQVVDPQLERLIGDCRAPKASNSCDSLKNWYLATAPRPREGTDSVNAYVQAQFEKKRQEAKQILDAAAPVLRGFADADLWMHVDLQSCAAASTRDACASVFQYISRFPDGRHVDDAKAVFVVADKRLTAKEQQQRAQAAAAQRMPAARSQQAPATSGSDDSNDRRRQAAGLANCLSACNRQRSAEEAQAANERAQECNEECGNDTSCLWRCSSVTPSQCQARCAQQYPSGADAIVNGY